MNIRKWREQVDLVQYNLKYGPWFFGDRWRRFEGGTTYTAATDGKQVTTITNTYDDGPGVYQTVETIINEDTFTGVLTPANMWDGTGSRPPGYGVRIHESEGPFGGMLYNCQGVIGVAGHLNAKFYREIYNSLTGGTVVLNDTETDDFDFVLGFEYVSDSTALNGLSTPCEVYMPAFNYGITVPTLPEMPFIDHTFLATLNSGTLSFTGINDNYNLIETFPGPGLVEKITDQVWDGNLILTIT